MKKMFIDSIRCANDIPCGQIPGATNAEAEVAVLGEKGDWKTTFVVLTRFDNVYALYETKKSIFDKLVANDDATIKLAKTDVEGRSELKAKIARSKFKKVYELLFALLAIPQKDIEDLGTDPIPDDDEA